MRAPLLGALPRISTNNAALFRSVVKRSLTDSVPSSQARNASHASTSQWPVTAAVSLLAFVAGLSIEGRWGKKGGGLDGKATALVSKHTLEPKDGTKEVSEDNTPVFTEVDASGQDSSIVPQSDETTTELKGGESGDTRDAANDNEYEEDYIGKPDLEPDDARGWRDFANTVHEKYSGMVQVLKKFQGKVSALEEGQAELAVRNAWLQIDSQRNADFVLEVLGDRDAHKRLVRDDDILRVHPLDPPEGLFETPIKATIIRVLDEKDLTRSMIVNLEGKAPSDDEAQANKQWDYVFDWFQDITKSMQQTNQISSEGFWNFLWSAGWYKCGIPCWSFPTRDSLFPKNEVNAIAADLKSTSDPGMERYRIPSDKSNIRPFSERLGNCSTTATVYPGDNDGNGNPREVQVLVDTGAELTIIKKCHVPEGVPVLKINPISVNGFGGASRELNERVALRMRLHGDDQSRGIDIVTTAMVMEETSSKLGIELGTDVMKPLGPVIDIKKSVIRVKGENGQVFEAPIKYLTDNDKIKDPTPQIRDSPASQEAPPTEKKLMQPAPEGQDQSA